MPKVSIVIPNYNHERYLRQRIDTVLRQTFQDFEVILMDDCSTDGSRSIISEYVDDPRVRIELNDKNSGSPFKQWNKGVQLAKGQYVWIAESDDYADERLLERLREILDKDLAITFAYCRSWKINEDGQRDGYADWYLNELEPGGWEQDFLVDGREACRKWFIRLNPVPNASAVVFRKAVYGRVGGADETLRMCGDWKLWAQLAFEGKVAYVSEPLNNFRVHSQTVRNQSQLEALDIAETLEVIHAVLKKDLPSKPACENLRKWVSQLWIPALLGGPASLKTRRRILQAAIALDSHALRRLLKPALVAVRMKIALELRLIRQRLERRAS
jgi:glycosyltransferase involved in cell wall biosynthesis